MNSVRHIIQFDSKYKLTLLTMTEIEDFELKYTQLLQQFNEYREKILKQKENQMQEFEKYRSHLDKTYKQMEKKYQLKLQEEKSVAEKKLRKTQLIWKQKQEELTATVQNKNRFIEELKTRLGEAENQKHQLIEDHTRMLYDLCQDIEESQKNIGPHKNSYQDLVRLYQFVLEENNTLKKELFKSKLANKQQGNEQQRQKASSKVAHVIKKEERKKKLPFKNTLDDSKTHNQSMRVKGHGTLKKEGNKRVLN